MRDKGQISRRKSQFSTPWMSVAHNNFPLKSTKYKGEKGRKLYRRETWQTLPHPGNTSQQQSW